MPKRRQPLSCVMETRDFRKDYDKMITEPMGAPKGLKSCRAKRRQRKPRPQSRVKARKGRTEMVVKPINFSWDELLGHETALREDAGNGGLLIRLEGER